MRRGSRSRWLKDRERTWEILEAAAMRAAAEELKRQGKPAPQALSSEDAPTGPPRPADE